MVGGGWCEMMGLCFICLHVKFGIYILSIEFPCPNHQEGRDQAPYSTHHGHD